MFLWTNCFPVKNTLKVLRVFFLCIEILYKVYLYIFVHTCHYFFVFWFPLFQYTARKYSTMFYRLTTSVLFFVFFLEIFLVQYLPNLSESVIISPFQKISQTASTEHKSTLPHDRRKTAPEIRKYTSQVFKYSLTTDYNVSLPVNFFLFSTDTFAYLISPKNQQRWFFWDRRINIKKTSVKLLHTPYKII